MEKFAYILRAVMAPLAGDTVNVLKNMPTPCISISFPSMEPLWWRMFISAGPATVQHNGVQCWSVVWAGGAGMFAIDVTDPTQLNANSILWDKKSG